jgi:enamine deaminase RidA (YjgF/YER057c/UK114 family)
MTMKPETTGVFEEINPPALGAPRGFSHGLVVQAGWQLLFVAGQTAATVNGEVAERSFASQFAAALDNTLAVVRAAGALPEHIVRMTVYVADMEAYRASRPRLNDVWRERMGRHYPAMSLVAVTALVDRAATVEIEATAAFPQPSR